MFRCLVLFICIICSVMGAGASSITTLCRIYDAATFMCPEEDMVHLFALKKDGEPEVYIGLRNKMNETVREAEYRLVCECYQLGFYVLRDKNGLCGCILSTNETVVDFKYKNIQFKYMGNKNVMFTCITPDGQIETKNVRIQDKPWRERYFLMEEKYDGNLFNMPRTKLREETERAIASSDYKPDYIF